MAPNTITREDPVALRKIAGQTIRNARLSAKLTQAQLARLMEDNKHNVSNVEAGKRPFNVGTATKYEIALDAPRWSLVRYAENLGDTLSSLVEHTLEYVSRLGYLPAARPTRGHPTPLTAVS